MYGTHHRRIASGPILAAAGILAILALATAASAVVPLLTPPVWKSEDNDYSTGGVLVDLDGDGYLDLITANGNDMARQPIRVYYNRGGVLELEASWQSEDIGYNCHVDLGDFDGDGDLDLAVAVLGDPGTPQRDKVYENLGTGLSATPVWISGDLDNSFDLAWGDWDGDGDLDLAVACGETYTGVPQKSKIYRNDGGVLTTNAVWRTGPVDYTLDVAWGDVDNDGDLDLVCGNEFGPNRLYLNHGSGLDSIPAWESGDTWNTLQIDLGDVDGDGWLDLAVANNGQLGGPSNVAIYRNLGGTFESTPSWISGGPARQYYSAVTFGDCDHDGDLDLASGGWWEPVVVFENLGGTLETVPSFSWKFANQTKGLVVESVIWGDMDNSGSTAVIGESKAGNGVAKVFYTNERPLREILEVRAGGVPIDPASYAVDFEKGWIALSEAPPPMSGALEIDYVFSRQLDLLVTNWDPDDENLHFLHQIATGIAGKIPAAALVVLPNRPNPFNPQTTIPIVLEEPGRVSAHVYDAGGRLVRTLYEGSARAGSLELLWDGRDPLARPVSSGVYFARVGTNGDVRTIKMTLVR
jgi:hypothetical protein